MNVREVKSQKNSPAARYIKESVYKSIDNHLSKSGFLMCFIRPKGGNFFGREKCIYMEKSNKKTLVGTETDCVKNSNSHTFTTIDSLNQF